MPNSTKTKRADFWSTWGPWIRWIVPIVGATLFWFTGVDARLVKVEEIAHGAPTKAELQKQIDDAVVTSEKHLNQAVQPLREDVREIKTNVEWLRNSQKDRR